MKRTLVCLSVVALLGGALPAAAEAGQAYDQVMKFQPNADLAALEPGDFGADWQTASQPAPEAPKHGGMFGKMRDALDQAQGMAAMMKTGVAQSRYVAGSKERVDEVAAQKATITDCGARTIAHLDLKAKTYYVVSMDQPQTPRASGGSHAAPGPAATDDGTKISMTIVNKALGAKKVFGNGSNGYSSEITTVTTKANGDSATVKTNVKEYASASSHEWLNCSAGQTETGMGLAGALTHYNDMMRALGTHKDPRFTFSSSGPALPSTLAYFEAIQFSGGDGGSERQGRGGNFVITVERNNLRSISATDSIFSIPADFTKVDAP